MPRRILKAALVGLGVFVLFVTLSRASSRMGDSLLWGLVLGIGLIVTPIKAALYLATYLLFLICLLAPGLLFALVSANLFGKSTILIVAAWIAGILVGFKLCTSATFSAVLGWLRGLLERHGS